MISVALHHGTLERVFPPGFLWAGREGCEHRSKVSPLLMLPVDSVTALTVLEMQTTAICLKLLLAWFVFIKAEMYEMLSCKKLLYFRLINNRRSVVQKQSSVSKI